MRKTAKDKNTFNTQDVILEKENIFSDKEKLWKYFFGSEYKPEVKINFQNLKDYINKNKEDNSRRVMRDYNYKLGSPEDLCDYMIKNDISTSSITSLESLADNQKRCLADIFLELISFQEIKEKLGIAMLFWIWHYGYYYSDKRREKLKEYIIKNAIFFTSQEDFDILERSFETQRKIHKNNKANSATTLLGYIIEKNLQQTLEEKDIDQYLKKELGWEFSLQKFTPRYNNSSGKERDRYRKDVDKDGNTIEREKINRTSKYIKEKINGKEQSLEVANRKNHTIYSDRSGKIYKIFLDGPISFGIFNNKDPLALISFSAKDQETIFINQMQTVSLENIDRYGRTISQGVDPLVKTINWQEMLYNIVNILAHKYGFKKIIIQSGGNNKRIYKTRMVLDYDKHRERRVEIETNIPHLSIDIAQKIYDNFAKGHGFKKEKSSGDWKKKI